ncbi:hypothetical protein DRO32_04930 [Candidatus Bathyarchaeota archaeon]|nr:MAG: hypothetical protein DRO32_04930 [Candidatus Bathyarchaeota archaeon]
MSSEGRDRLFFLLSGEHPTLPHAELEAILEAEGFSFRPLSRLAQLSELECDRSCCRPVLERASMVRACCLELLRCPADEEAMLGSVGEAPLRELLRPGQSFRVRIRRVRGSCPGLDIMGLEKEIGSIIYGAVGGLKVDLRSPDVDFLGVLTEGWFFFGLKLGEARGGFGARRPSRRPFFHPTAMMPKLARCMVNLARARPGELILDPFCGTGSILVEAGLLGCRILGSDISPRMAFGCLLNLRFLGLEPDGIVVADALAPPFPEGDRVVTDPPYGRSASTAGRSTRGLYEDLLALIPELLPPGKMACLAAPSDLCVADMARDMGLGPVEAHYYFVHSGLTRELLVVRVP